MSYPLLVAGALVLMVLLIVLEGRRQTRTYGRGDGRSGALTRAGFMELQNLLEPERKVEVLREMERKEDLLVQLDDQGDLPKPRGRSATLPPDPR